MYIIEIVLIAAAVVAIVLSIQLKIADARYARRMAAREVQHAPDRPREGTERSPSKGAEAGSQAHEVQSGVLHFPAVSKNVSRSDPNTFLSIDVETANADYASICQIGIARFSGGKVSEEGVTLINPRDYFDEFNTSIHGINPQMVAGASFFSRVSHELRKITAGQVVVCHTHFDRVAISRAL